MSDFRKPLNGSDPNRADTDGDGIPDLVGVAAKSSVTGIEGTPSKIENVQNSVAVRWDWLALFYLPVLADINGALDVSDNVGIGTVVVKVVRGVGTEKPVAEIARGTPAGHIRARFGFPIIAALASGADVDIHACDVNGNGVRGLVPHRDRGRGGAPGFPSRSSGDHRVEALRGPQGGRSPPQNSSSKYCASAPGSKLALRAGRFTALSRRFFLSPFSSSPCAPALTSTPGAPLVKRM